MFAEFCLQCANQGRNQGNNDNSDDNQREVLFDDRKITEEVSRPAAKRNPSNYAGKAVRQKSLVLSTGTAENGDIVRMIGMKRASEMAIPPCFSKNASVFFK